MMGTKTLVFGSFLLIVLTAPVQAQRLPLPRDEQDAVNRAIDRGVVYLLQTELPNGTWTKDGHKVGYSVLPALTLLECGVPASDPHIQRALAFLRTHEVKLDTTYELSLAILFLDRIGDPRDDKAIRFFALRLIAGQTVTGGWGYKCPILSSVAHAELLNTLRSLDPAPPKDEAKPLEKDSPPRRDDNPVTKPDKPVFIPARLRILSVIADPKLHVLKDPEGKTHDLIVSTTDNSNSQFATLALWVAQRHGVPFKRTAYLIDRRYTSSQNTDGGWGYHYRNGGGEGGSPAMTCAGLIGLAVGHGLAEQARAGQPVKDPRIVNGLAALSKFVGVPEPKLGTPPMNNLYFLYALERVAVLYNLPKIGDKDWYRWGAQILVANQKPDGQWDSTDYPGHHPTIDTCLALLFLKRANLAKDLTAKLPFQSTDLNKKVLEKIGATPKPPKTILPVATNKPAEKLLDKPTTPEDRLLNKPTTAEDRLLSKPTQEEGLLSKPQGDGLFTKPSSEEANGEETADDASQGGAGRWVALGLFLVLVVGCGGLIVFLVVSQRKVAVAQTPAQPKAS